MFIVSRLSGQTPFDVDQINEFVPADNPETDDELSVGVFTDDPPPITDQVPVPTAGIIAFKTAEVVVAQNTWFGPATATLGNASTITDKLLVDGGQVLADSSGQAVEAKWREVSQEQGGRRAGLGGDFAAEDLSSDAHRAGSGEQGIESGGHYRLLKRLRAQLMCDVRKWFL